MAKRLIIKKRNKNWFLSHFKEAKNILAKNQKYSYAAFLIMVVFAVLGYIFHDFMADFQNQVLDNLVSQVPVDNPASTVLFIIQNNLKAAFLAMILGILIVVPFIMLMANGFIIGAVLHKAIESLGFWISLKLLPHGIFEIPAICIASGFGLKIALGIFRRESVYENYRDALIVFAFIVFPLLVLAGIVEGTLFYLFR